MNVSSRTTEGRPLECPLCGKSVWITPSQPAGDATCPHCGTLLWFSGSQLEAADPVRRLTELGADVDVDNEGQVSAVTFSGKRYNDSVVEQLAGLSQVPVIDIRNTKISPDGARRLRELLPGVTVRY